MKLFIVHKVALNMLPCQARWHEFEQIPGSQVSEGGVESQMAVSGRRWQLLLVKTHWKFFWLIFKISVFPIILKMDIERWNLLGVWRIKFCFIGTALRDEVSPGIGWMLQTECLYLPSPDVESSIPGDSAGRWGLWEVMRPWGWSLHYKVSALV